MDSGILTAKENKPNYKPGESPAEMMQRISSLTATVASQQNTIAELMKMVEQMNETIAKLQNENIGLKTKNNELEDRLAAWEKNRSSDSEHSNSPPLMK